MHVKPFHGQRPDRNTQPVEGDSVDKSSGNRDGGGDAHGSERHRQHGLHGTQTARSGNRGAQSVGKQENEGGFRRIRVVSKRHQCCPESQSGRKVKHQCAGNAKGQFLWSCKHIDQVARVCFDHWKVFLGH